MDLAATVTSASLMVLLINLLPLALRVLLGTTWGRNALAQLILKRPRRNSFQIRCQVTSLGSYLHWFIRFYLPLMLLIGLIQQWMHPNSSLVLGVLNRGR